jgi:hypothetical protein
MYMVIMPKFQFSCSAYMEHAGYRELSAPELERILLMECVMRVLLSTSTILHLAAFAELSARGDPRPIIFIFSKKKSFYMFMYIACSVQETQWCALERR